MTTAKLKEIIADKNAQLERSAVDAAEQHINHIIKMQRIITEAQSEIKEAQEALKALEVQQLDHAVILGGE